MSLLSCSNRRVIYFIGLKGFTKCKDPVLSPWNIQFDQLKFCWFSICPPLRYGNWCLSMLSCTKSGIMIRMIVVFHRSLQSVSKIWVSCIFVTKCEASSSHQNRLAIMLVDLLRQILFYFQFIDQFTHVKLPITVNSHQRSGSDKLNKCYRTVWKV